MVADEGDGCKEWLVVDKAGGWEGPECVWGAQWLLTPHICGENITFMDNKSDI